MFFRGTEGTAKKTWPFFGHSGAQKSENLGVDEPPKIFQAPQIPLLQLPNVAELKLIKVVVYNKGEANCVLEDFRVPASKLFPRGRGRG